MNWKQFIYRYKHIFVALYFPVYMVWFMWLEARDDVPFTYIHCAIDDYIPFCEYFIIPYLLWFVYVFATLALLFFRSEAFRKLLSDNCHIDHWHDSQSVNLYFVSKCTEHATDTIYS